DLDTVEELEALEHLEVLTASVSVPLPVTMEKLRVFC
ncbi:unnamed protein product, partial [Brassica oleracea]